MLICCSATGGGWLFWVGWRFVLVVVCLVCLISWRWFAFAGWWLS